MAGKDKVSRKINERDELKREKKYSKKVANDRKNFLLKTKKGNNEKRKEI